MGRTLLVVDDEPEIGRLFARMLAAHFERIAVATEAREALDALERSEITHLICDLRLGGEDGEALLAGLKERFPALEELLVFTGDREAIRERSIAGATAFYLKPDDFDALIARLRTPLAAQGRK